MFDRDAVWKIDVQQAVRATGRVEDLMLAVSVFIPLEPVGDGTECGNDGIRQCHVRGTRNVQFDITQDRLLAVPHACFLQKTACRAGVVRPRRCVAVEGVGRQGLEMGACDPDA